QRNNQKHQPGQKGKHFLGLTYRFHDATLHNRSQAHGLRPTSINLIVLGVRAGRNKSYPESMRKSRRGAPMCAPSSVGEPTPLLWSNRRADTSVCPYYGG